VSIADLGGNIRLALVSASQDGPIAEAVLVWLPPSGSDDQTQQNQVYRDGFAVLMKTVDDKVTADEQATTAGELGLGPDAPPFPAGTSADAEQGDQAFRLQTAQPEGQTGVDTLIGVSAAS
jgi:hypothetical protein